MIEQFEGEIDWNDIQKRWHLESELRQNIPRPVAMRGEKPGCGGRAVACFLGGMVSFMFLVGALMSAWAGLALLILPFGFPTEGIVTRHEVTTSSGKIKGTKSYFLHFRFTRGGQDYRGEWPVSQRVFTETLDGEAIQVRYFPFAPGLRPMIEKGASPWFYVWALGPLGLLMLAVFGVILPAFLLPKRGKWLVRRGIATPAIVVTQAKAENGKNGAMTYLFRAQERTWEKTRRMNSLESWPTDVGTLFTVLHHPKHPRRALIYQFCDFRARD